MYNRRTWQVLEQGEAFLDLGDGFLRRDLIATSFLLASIRGICLDHDVIGQLESDIFGSMNQCPFLA